MTGSRGARSATEPRPAINRIFVEEAVLTEVMGRAYTDYAAGTKRLVPGLW